MAFASLTIDLNARLANIERDLGKSVHMAEKSAQKMQAAFSGVGKTLAAFGVIGVGGGMAAFAKSSIDAADNLNDLNKATGVTVENLAGLQLVAENSGTNLDSLAKGIGKLNKYMGEASLGNAEAQSTLASLGVTAKDPMEAFFQLADAFGRFGDEGERATIMSKVLGKSWAELAPALSEGGAGLRAMVADGRALNPITQEMAEQADKFNDALGRFKIAATGAGTAIAIDLLPGLISVAEGFDRAAKSKISFLGGAALGVNIFNAPVQQLKDLREEIKDLEGQQETATSLGLGRYKSIDAKIAQAKELKAALEAVQQGEALALLDKVMKSGNQKPELIFSAADADKQAAALRKAFDIKPLDDFIIGFKDRRQSIEKEYAQLIAKLTGPSITNATGGDLSYQIAQGRGALARGDSTGTEVAVDRARQMLEGLKDNGGADFEIRYYADELKRLELAMVESQRATAENARSAMLEQLNAAAAEVAKMDPLHIPIAADAIAQDVRATLDVIRKELAANPLQVPVVATRASGIYGNDNISTAALKVGAR